MSLFGKTNHVCGCYILQPGVGRKYLPQVGLKTHVTIQATAYTALLTQTFVNPLSHDAIEKLRYTFPLYDGVSVVDFECRIGKRVIKGLVKERQEAKATFDAAVQRGETAGLLEQLPEASDVFTTTLGNIPPNSNIQVTIRYVGELKHDAEIDGLRFTLPTAIAPRYGAYPFEMLGNASPALKDAGMEIAVDVDLPEALPIQKITSPSHPIAVSIGTLSSGPDADASLSRGSATLAAEKTGLEKDFVLQVAAKNLQSPQALLESHPTIPNQRALMATFVPKFALKPARPEIIFIVDRSGSMAGNIGVLVAALRVFIKSLPPGVRFNICSYGSSARLLWDKSKKYDEATMKQALAHVETFDADFGGTETLGAIKIAVESRWKDLPTELMLLTDGDIWNQGLLFDYLNEQVSESKGDVRLFTLGIGGGVSHALIEGAARAGNGFSQAVGDGERLDGKVVRMLKGALSPHINDYTFEVKYNADDDFEMVDRAPRIDTAASVASKTATISLFDADSKDDASPERGEKTAHLPTIEPPNVLQAPTRIPSLFPFSRTTVYLLLAPSTGDKIPETVTFRGTSPQGPVELTIPVTAAQPGATIHQLAARKAVLDLEEGRGWLLNAVDSSGEKLQKRSPSQYEDMCEREAVRLGTTFQVGSKWCSFVAVETNEQTGEVVDDFESVDTPAPAYSGGLFGGQSPAPPAGLFGSQSLASSERQFGGQSAFGGGARRSAPGGQALAFGLPPPAPLMAAPRPTGSGLISSVVAHAPAMPPPPPGSSSVSMASVQSCRKQAPAGFSAPIARDRSAPQEKKKKRSSMFGRFGSTASTESAMEAESESESLLDRIIAAQTFEGFWKLSSLPWSDMSISADRVKKLGDDQHRNDLLVTAVVVLYLEEKMPEERDAWELVVDKARAWIDELKSLERREGDVDIWGIARSLL